jgi:hypothetical protein
VGQAVGWSANHLDPVIARSSIRLDVEPNLNRELRQLARGRPLVVDYYAVPLRGLRVGDITAGFPSSVLEPCYVELEPTDGVRILAHRRLLKLLTDGGATLRFAGVLAFRHLAVILPHPERWIEFLERCPPRARRD